MARYHGPVCRLCRREGVKLFLKGEKCSAKCVLDKRATPPGQAKKSLKMKTSEYSKRLREKQKARQYIGMLEKQFRRYFEKSEKLKGLTGENLLCMLETRLDNVCRRIGFSTSLKGARQMVSHGHIQVNGRKVDIPSFHVQPGDTIQLLENMKNNVFVSKSLEFSSARDLPSWLEYKKDSLTAKVVKLPGRDEISIPVSEQLIVELYSK
ncbi:MAG: 30S ribosomal protein S4 [bacterium]